MEVSSASRICAESIYSLTRRDKIGAPNQSEVLSPVGTAGCSSALQCRAVRLNPGCRRGATTQLSISLACAEAQIHTAGPPVNLDPFQFEPFTPIPCLNPRQPDCDRFIVVDLHATGRPVPLPHISAPGL